MSAKTFLTRVCSSILFSLLAIWPVSIAKADEVAVWNFNDSNLSVDHGAGTLTTNFNLVNVIFTLAGSTSNARLGDVAGQSMTLQGGTSNSNNGRFITLAVSTVGYSNIVLSLATQATSTGFRNNQVQYSLDGINFVNFGAAYTPATVFGMLSFDFSGITALNNNPNAAFRIVFDGATSASGNNRIDNIVIDGSPVAVPEPASITLLSVGLGGLIARRFRNRRC